VVLAAGGSDEPTLVDRFKAQSDVQSFIKARTKVDMSVTCPDDVKAKEGATFTCDGVADNETDAAVVRVTSTDDTGKSTRQRLAKLTYGTEYIEDNAKRYFAKQKAAGRIKYEIRTVTCPETFTVTVGAKFKCPVVFDDGVKDAFPVTIKDLPGKYTIGYKKDNGELR